MIRISILLCLLTISFTIGCHSEPESSIASYSSSKTLHAFQSRESNDRNTQEMLGGMSRMADFDGVGFDGTTQNSIPAANAEESEALESTIDSISKTPSLGRRKIIFNSNIELSVANFGGIQTKVSALIRRHGGFVAEAKVHNQNEQAQSGRWTIRVPVSSYHQLMNSMGELGEIISRNEKAKDVTAEFYDLEARIRNKEQLEMRIVKLLENAKGDLRKLIEVERELGRVREEIERMQGQLRLLADITGMSTIELNVMEKNKKPEPVLAASFSNRISDAWNNALREAKITVQNFAVAVVQNIFNIGTTVFILLVGYLLIRRIVRHADTQNMTANQTSS